MNNRISAIIKAKKIKKAEFAKRLKISQPFVSELCSGAKSPSDRTITDICREFNVSEVWLRTGDGEMFVQLDEDAEFAQVCEEINLSNDRLIKQIIKTYWRMREDEKAVVRKLIDEIAQK